MYCKFGRSGDVGVDHPLCAISPQTGRVGGIVTVPSCSPAVPLDPSIFSDSPSAGLAIASRFPGSETIVGGSVGIRGRESHAIAALRLRLATIIRLTFLFTSPFSIGM